MHPKALLEQSGEAGQPTFVPHVLILPLPLASQAPSTGCAGVGPVPTQNCAFTGPFKIPKVERTQLFPAGIAVTVRDPRAGVLGKGILSQNQRAVPAAFHTSLEMGEFMVQVRWTYSFPALHRADIALLGSCAACTCLCWDRHVAFPHASGELSSHAYTQGPTSRRCPQARDQGRSGRSYIKY